MNGEWRMGGITHKKYLNLHDDLIATFIDTSWASNRFSL